VGLGVGAGVSRFAENEECEIIGMEVSHLVDAVQKTASDYPLFNLIQASVLAPPLRSASFDVVYSYGSLNRISNPKKGFIKISALPKSKGRLSLWFDSHRKGRLTRMQNIVVHAERWLRPMFSHFPRQLRNYAIMSCTPLYLMHQRFFSDFHSQASLMEGVRSALTVAQQRLQIPTPHNLNDAEVKAWFEGLGYVSSELLKEAGQPLPFPLALWACSGVEGVRA
jgi:hypothetical protein